MHLATGRLAGALLFGVTAHDPLNLASTMAVFIVIVLAATWWPARQATRVDPVTAMRA